MNMGGRGDLARVSSVPKTVGVDQRHSSGTAGKPMQTTANGWPSNKAYNCLVTPINGTFYLFCSNIFTSEFINPITVIPTNQPNDRPLF